MANVKDFLKLRADQYAAIKNGETVAGHTYDPNTIYLVDDPHPNIIDANYDMIGGDFSVIRETVMSNPGSLLSVDFDENNYLIGKYLYTPCYGDMTLPTYYVCFAADEGCVYWLSINWDDGSFTHHKDKIATMSDVYHLVLDALTTDI